MIDVLNGALKHSVIAPVQAEAGTDIASRQHQLDNSDHDEIAPSLKS